MSGWRLWGKSEKKESEIEKARTALKQASKEVQTKMAEADIYLQYLKSVKGS